MTDSTRYPLLSQIDYPSDLRALAEQDLPAVCSELRDFIIQSVAQTGGHLGASLGTVELSVALHRVFNTPDDRLIWDVGHQAYPHKILTGRREAMHSIRQKDGLSGFPKRGESEYDAFGVGHSSTSISAAVGMAMAAQAAGTARKTIAVIGDGAMTAGMAFEALNHAGDLNTDMLVVLNDNHMSISPNVGALNTTLTRMISVRWYDRVRRTSKALLRHTPAIANVVKRGETRIKRIIAPATLFEELGFRYIGPVDGHDIQHLVTVLENVREQQGPILLHAVTQKGKGYKFAEEDALALHAVTPFDPDTGQQQATASTGPTYTKVFGEWLCDMAERDQRLFGITPAMREGSGMVEFDARFPGRFIDVGIAEQHAVTLAAGLACEQQRPVVAIYSTFLQRAYDQLLHDVALQQLPVLFAIDRAGLVGPDGPTHAGSFDFSFMRCLPNMLIMAPANENECRQMLYTGFLHKGPASVRYPRGRGPGEPASKTLQALEIGKEEIRRRGQSIAILAFGTMVEPAQEAGEAINATVVNMRFVKPLDQALIDELADSHDLLVTVEENAVMGGVGSAVAECLLRENRTVPVLMLGIPDHFQEQGSRDELLTECGLDAEGILASILNHLPRQVSEPSFRLGGKKLATVK